MLNYTIGVKGSHMSIINIIDPKTGKVNLQSQLNFGGKFFLDLSTSSARKYYVTFLTQLKFSN